VVGAGGRPARANPLDWFDTPRRECDTLEELKALPWLGRHVRVTSICACCAVVALGLPRLAIADPDRSVAVGGEDAKGDRASVSTHAPPIQVESVQTPESTEADRDLRFPARQIELHAGHVEIEGPFKRLSLSEGVELTVHRYRVTADRLTLERTSQGILVDGKGRVAFCQCASSPLTVGFSRATVAPPTDLLLRNATFRACGLPVFWLPTYWVRSPNKLGLLTPKIAWRAADGPLIGTGVHVPLSFDAETSDGALETLLGAYLLGGVDLGMQLRTPRTTTSVRWDHRERSMLGLDASGYRHWPNQVSLSWQLDAWRGQRSRTGPVTFEVATRSYDRLRTEIAFADGQSVYALGFHGDVVRATPFAQSGQFGPAARWGVGVALGDFGRIDSSFLIIGRLRKLENGSATAMHSSDLSIDMRPSPMSVRWTLRERWLLGSGAQGIYDTGLLGSELRVSLPFAAEFGNRTRRFAHWLEPFALGTAAYAGGESAYGGGGARGPVATAQLGLLNTFGYPTDSAATSLQARAGYIFARDERTQAIAARWLSSGNWLSLGGDVGWAGGDVWLSSARARVGRVDRVAIRSRLEGRGPTEPTQIRWLLDEAWSPWSLSWYSRTGWLMSENLDIAVGHQIAVTAGLAYDVGHGAFVAEQAGAAYRHPCGCLAASTRTDWRVGRGGWDVLIALDLMP
jgi:hypothetical protein